MFITFKIYITRKNNLKNCNINKIFRNKLKVSFHYKFIYFYIYIINIINEMQIFNYTKLN